MPRVAKPAIQKIQDQVALLSDEEFDELGDWLATVVDVREWEKQRAKRKAATEPKP